MYVVRCTRLDVAFAQNLTSRIQQNSGECHWIVVKNILKYLRNTKDVFIVYGGDLKRKLKVTCSTDTGFETDKDNRKSQMGYVFVLNGGVVDRKSESSTVMSSIKAEYIVAFEASMQAVWIRKFIFRLRVIPTNKEPMKMYDNIK
ncbi:hypothetical protein Tco_0433421 [Tanacetum coccineum]